ncbi:unnamed protein product, partial [Meganyctiphanes norvegica]
MSCMLQAKVRLIVLRNINHIPHNTMNQVLDIRKDNYRVSIAYSSYRGWGLHVMACFDVKKYSCYNDNILAKDGYTLSEKELEKHPFPKSEGLTFTVLNQRNGKPIFHKKFPLQYYWSFWADLQWHLNRVSPGRIVVLSFAVRGAIGLRYAIDTLKLLGSVFVHHLFPNSQWLWFYIQGGKTLSESVIVNGQSEVYSSTVLESRYLNSMNNKSTVDTQRWNYCENYGAMGGLCDEYMPDDFMYTSPIRLPHQNALDNIPIIVAAGSRNQYLYFTLYKLLRTPGIVKDNILVILGNTHQGTLQLLQLMNLNYKQVSTVDIEENYTLNKANQKLFLYYRKVFELASELYSTAPAVIFMDEDVEVSPDFLSYMSQTLRLLYEDPTLYCINGYTQIGLNGLAHHPSRIYRGNVQVQWGYAVTLDFIRESLAVWPKNGTIEYASLYDFWLYHKVRGDRECVFPELSRTKHYGIGINILPLITEKCFVGSQMVNSSGIELPDVGHLELSIWRKDLTNSIKKSFILVGNPCKDGFLPQPTYPTNFTFYYYRRDFEEYNIVAKCFRTWDFSMTGDHEGVTIISPAPKVHIFMVAYPNSTYAYLKPKPVKPFNIDSYSDKEY